MSARQPVVALVHGFLGTPEDWAPMRAALRARGIDGIITVDLLECASTPECAAWLDRAMRIDPESLPETDALDALATEAQRRIRAAASGAGHAPGSVALCGYSLGGRICLALAGRMPDTPACILIGADPGIEDPRERSLRAGRDHAHAVHLMQDPEGFLAAWYAQPLFASLRHGPEFGAVLARRRGALGDPAVRAQWARILEACSPGRCVPRWDAAVRLGSHLAMIHGALDDKFAAIARRLHAREPQVPTISIRGAGHAAHVEQAEACADAIASIVCPPAPAHR